MLIPVCFRQDGKLIYTPSLAWSDVFGPPVVVRLTGPLRLETIQLRDARMQVNNCLFQAEWYFCLLWRCRAWRLLY